MQGNYFNIGAYHSDDFGAQLKKEEGEGIFFNKAIFFPQWKQDQFFSKSSKLQKACWMHTTTEWMHIVSANPVFEVWGNCIVNPFHNTCNSMPRRNMNTVWKTMHEGTLTHFKKLWPEKQHEGTYAFHRKNSMKKHGFKKQKKASLLQHQIAFIKCWNNQHSNNQPLKQTEGNFFFFFAKRQGSEKRKQRQTPHPQTHKGRTAGSRPSLSGSSPASPRISPRANMALGTCHFKASTWVALICPVVACGSWWVTQNSSTPMLRS